MSRRLVLIAALLGSTATLAEPSALETLWTQAPFSVAAPSLAKAGADDAPKDQSVDVLLVRTTITLDAEGRRTWRYHTVFRVLKADAVQAWDSLGATWAPWYEDRPTLKARVITPKGQVLTLDPKTASEKPAFDDQRSMYTDMKTVVAPLPGLAAGVTVEQEVTVTETKAPFPKGNAGRLFFHRSVPVRRFHVVVDAPESLPLKLAWAGHGLAGTKATETFTEVGTLRQAQGERRTRHLEASFPDPKWDPDQHASNDFPHLTYTTGSSWAEVAKAYASWLDEASTPGVDTSELKAKVAKLKTRKEKVQAALTWMQSRVRYTGLELSEASLKPWTPAQVWEREYGDCKDMALFLVRALDAIGVKAKVALLSVGGALDVSDAMPGLGLFDHAIVYVPKDASGPELWVDATHPGMPAGELPALDLGRLTLPIDAATTGLVPTPPRLSQKNGVADLVTVELAPFGPSQVRERRTYSGSVGGDMRQGFKDKSPEKLKDALEGRAKGFYRGKSFEVALEHLPTDSGPFVVQLDVRKAGLFSTDWSEARLVLPELTILENVNEYLRGPVEEEPDPDAAAKKPDEEKKPLELAPFSWREPLWLERTFLVVPPRGFTLETLPENATRSFGKGTWTETWTKRKDGGVEATFRFEPKGVDFTVEDVKAFRAAWKALRMKDRPTLVYKHEALSLISTDKAEKGVALFRKLLDQEPDDALTRARLATSLLDLGLGIPARAEAEHAAHDAPHEPAALMAEGSVAEHDLFGRLFQPGWQRTQAIDSLRRALAGDPDSSWAKKELSRALERDVNGDLVSKGPDAAEALKLWHQLALDDKDTEAIGPYLDALWRLRRWEELIDAADKLSSQGLEERALAAVAVVKGPKAATARAKEKWPDTQARARAVVTANQSLLYAREYAVAKELLGLNKSILPPDVATQLSGLLAHLGRAAPSKDSKTPEAAMRAFIGLALDADTPQAYLDRFGELASAPMRRHLAEDLKQARSASRLAAKIGFDASNRELMLLGLDSLLSVATFKVDGSAETGFRVRALAEVGNRKIEMRGYFVKEGDELKLLAVDNTFGALGEHVMVLAQAGKLEAAKQWTQWAAEALPEVRVPHVVLFHEVWPPEGPPTAESLSLAGALLASDDVATGGPALDLLLKAGDAAKGSRRVKLFRAAGFAALRLKRFDDAAKAFGEVVADDESAEETGTLALCLSRARRFDELEKLVNRRLLRLPDSPEWLEWTAQLASKRQKYDEAVKVYAKILEKKGDATQALNNAAWARLMAQKVDDETERLATRAVETEGKRALASLHTLALVQLERGKVKSAVDTLRLRLSRLPQGELEGADWYVVGRLAEVFGYPKEAKDAYQKVGADDDDDTKVLTARRLSKLKGG